MRTAVIAAAAALAAAGGTAAITLASPAASAAPQAKTLTLARLEHDIVNGYQFSISGQDYRAYQGVPRWIVSPMLPVRSVEKRLRLHGPCVLVLLPSSSTSQRGWVLCRDGQVRKIG